MREQRAPGIIPDAVVYGPQNSRPTQSLNAALFPGVYSEAVLLCIGGVFVAFGRG